MRPLTRSRLTLALALALAPGCTQPTNGGAASSASSAPVASTTPPEARWLAEGSTDERFTRVAKHLRGFDVAMAEVGYRYGELHWAGKDHNWGYAAYQLAKIETAVANGVERRPKRAASARMLEAPSAAMKRAIEGRDSAAFDAAFASLTAACNACHQAEQVPFIRVEPPAIRASIVHAPEGAP